MTQTISNMTIFTSKLIELLSAGKVGDILTDEQLTAHCGRQTAVGEPGYVNLTSAIKNVERNYGLVWRRMRGASAIECQDFTGKLAIATQNQRQINRRSKRTLLVLGTVRQDEIPDGQKVAYTALVAQIGVLASMSSTNTTKQLEARQVAAVDPKRLLDAIVASNGNAGAAE